MFLILQLISSEYVYQDILNRCNRFNISGDHCRNSIYFPRQEYDDYVRSFNLPVQKAPECSKKECKIVVYKDPPRIVINASNNEDFCLTLGQNHPLCKSENPYKYVVVPQQQPQNVTYTSTENKTVTEINPITITKKGKTSTKTVDKTTTVTETKKEINTISEQKSKDSIIKTITEYKTIGIKSPLQVEPSIKTIPAPEIKVVTKNEIRTITVDDEKKNYKFKDEFTQTEKDEQYSGKRTKDLANYIFDEANKKGSKKQQENFITLIQYKTVTKTQETPITLYRETIKTITKEKPIINYKVTTVTDIDSVTKTIEKSITVIRSTTNSVTTTYTIPTTITQQITSTITPTISAPSSTVNSSSIHKSIQITGSQKSSTTPSTRTITKEIPTTIYVNKTISPVTNQSTAISPIVDEIMKILGEREEKDPITTTKTVYETEIRSEDKKPKTVYNTVYEYKKKPKCKIRVKQYPGSKFSCSEDGQKIIVKTVYVKPQVLTRN
ncbi:hypothetical protein SLOPH_1706 [Spraguea lophii 42_110]|uniref:Uncharacterized protein n=1 Tax=Spraguea lophii (strain 42_110) TaxID=1358809 RepID=S7W8G5_SPRLO|nr:hypothetical protein SLOPH_1706 [Spraguea lophii 42_110]